LARQYRKSASTISAASWRFSSVLGFGRLFSGFARNLRLGICESSNTYFARGFYLSALQPRLTHLTGEAPHRFNFPLTRFFAEIKEAEALENLDRKEIFCSTRLLVQTDGVYY